MNPTVRRLAASVGAWTVGAAASVAVSLLALSSINAGSAAGPSQQLVPDGLTKAAPAASTTASPDPDGTATTSPAAPQSSSATTGPTANSVQRLLSSPGGTVIARCTGTTAYLVSWSPAQGYQVADAERGPALMVEVTFRNATSRFEVEVRCVAGAPALVNGNWGQDHNR